MDRIKATGAPFIAIPKTLVGRLSPYELAVVVALQSHYPNIHPGKKLLSKESGVGETKLKEVLRSLQEKGLLSKSERHSESGRQSSNCYEMNLWQGDVGGRHTTGEGSPHDWGEGSPHDPKEEQEKNKNKLKGPADEVEEIWKSIPDALKPVEHALRRFWDTKGGKKTAIALQHHLSEAEKIREVAGLDSLRETLERGVSCSINGKAWQGLSFLNWKRMNATPAQIKLIEQREKTKADRQNPKTNQQVESMAKQILLQSWLYEKIESLPNALRVIFSPEARVFCGLSSDFEHEDELENFIKEAIYLRGKFSKKTDG